MAEASRPLPHEGVLVRLRVSKIHGIGVFAAEPIPAGTNVFAADHAELTWVPQAVLEDASLSEFHRSLYGDFAIRSGGMLGCPASFELLTVGWYCNEPRDGDEPNLTPSATFDLIAARDIECGEELTVRYAAFTSIAS